MRSASGSGGILGLIGDELRERAGVRYHELGARSVLNRCDTDRMPDCWTINPYRGCSFACRYCYARYSHAYLGLEDPLEFERQIFVKRDAVATLEAEVSARRLLARPIAIGTATDPYQPAERTYRLTRGILEVLARFPGIELSLTTKSALVVRDVDLLQRIAQRGSLSVRVTLPTLNAALARTLEPGAPGPTRRLRTVQSLAEARIPVGINVLPVLPELTDDASDIARVLSAAHEAGAKFGIVGPLFLTQSTRAFFFAWLAREHPELVPRYRAIFPPPVRGAGEQGDVAAGAGRRWREELRRRTAWARRVSGLPAFRSRRERPPEQLGLFGKEAATATLAP